jgi:hypothetical protein
LSTKRANSKSTAQAVSAMALAHSVLATWNDELSMRANCPGEGVSARIGLEFFTDVHKGDLTHALVLQFNEQRNDSCTGDATHVCARKRREKTTSANGKIDHGESAVLLDAPGTSNRTYQLGDSVGAATFALLECMIA